MKKSLPIFIYLLIINTKLATPQFLRPPFNLLNRPETLIEQTNFIPNPTVINELPCNNIVPMPTATNPPTTIITDCSPTICKQLADTIQLMIACNLLQNTQGGPEMALHLAAPIINDVMSSPTFFCGCGNPSDIISPSFNAPNFATPKIIPPNIITPNGISSLPLNKPAIYEPFPPTMMSPSLMSQNLPTSALNPNFLGSMPQISPNFASNLMSPNVISPYFIPPNVAPLMSPDMGPQPPRLINPPNSCSNNALSPNIIAGIPNRVPPNVPIGAAVSNTNGLINTIMSILGNAQ